MSFESFSEWLRRQGHRVVRTESSHWFDRGPRVLMAFPWHQPIRPSEEELQRLVRTERAIALRFTAPVTGAQGVVGYDVVLGHADYDLGNVSKTNRQIIPKALARCEIQPIDFERYAREGWLLEVDTRERQGRAWRGGREAWEKMARAATDLDGFEAWGATVDGRLAASAMLARVDDCVHVLYQQSHREFWPLRVNHAFMFSVARMLVARRGVRLVHYGLQGLDAPPSVDDFKVHLGFVRRPVRHRVVLHPLIAPLVNGATRALLGTLRARWKTNALLSKGEGLVRLFLEGRRPEPGAPASGEPAAPLPPEPGV